jgi:hypothetical protein
MLMVLLGAGIGLLLVGLGALGYGIPIKEFGWGNTLIISGVLAACSGILMIGLWVVARELQNISQRLGSGAATRIQAAFPAESSLSPALAPLPPPPRAVAEDIGAAHGGVSPRMDEHDEMPPPPAPVEAAPAPKPRRNLLFTSTSRKERERAAARASEPLAPDLLSADLRPHPPAADTLPVDAGAPTPPTFDDAWPKSERARRTGGRTNAPPEAEPAAPARDDKPQVTVLKSGVVDGMAYSLYSDGSIEAQMPEGMMRFASIDELRAHLDQRP